LARRAERECYTPRVHLEDDHLLLDHVARPFPLAGARVQFAPWCRLLGGRVGSAILLENGSVRLCVGGRGARLDAHLETGAAVHRVDTVVDSSAFYELARDLREHLARRAPFREADMLSGAPRSGSVEELEPPLFRSAFAADRRRTAVWCACLLGLLGVGGTLAVSGPSRDTVDAQVPVTQVVFKEVRPSPPARKMPQVLPIDVDERPCGHLGQPKCCGDRGAPPCKDPANWWRMNPEVPGY